MSVPSSFRRLPPLHKKYQQEEDYPREVVDQEEGVYKGEAFSRREVLEEDLIEQLHQCDTNKLCD